MSIEGRDIKFFIDDKEVEGIKTPSLTDEEINTEAKIRERYITGRLHVGYMPDDYWDFKNGCFALNGERPPRGKKWRKLRSMRNKSIWH